MPARVRFVGYEAFCVGRSSIPNLSDIHWAIVGGESGRGRGRWRRAGSTKSATRARDLDTVHAAGVSVRGKEVKDDDLEDRIVSWPTKLPKAARRKAGTQSDLRSPMTRAVSVAPAR